MYKRWHSQKIMKSIFNKWKANVGKETTYKLFSILFANDKVSKMRKIELYAFLFRKFQLDKVTLPSLKFNPFFFLSKFNIFCWFTSFLFPIFCKRVLKIGVMKLLHFLFSITMSIGVFSNLCLKSIERSSEASCFFKHSYLLVIVSTIGSVEVCNAEVSLCRNSAVISH